MEDSERHSQFESPLRYPGGKACIFPFISNLFYENGLLGVDYAEPYAGGSGLALKLLFNEYVNHIHINDFDYSIYSFWKSILESNQRFCDWVEDVQVDIDNWNYYKSVQKKPKEFSQFELGQAVFFLNRTNISGVIKGGAIGGLEQKGKYKITARFNKTDLIKRIERISKFKHRISLTNHDGLNFIRQLNQKKLNTFIYLDPPYVHKGADLYMNYFKKKDHKKLAQQVEKINHKWLVSYDDNDFIINLYGKQKKLRYRLSQSASNRVGNEILVFADQLKFDQSKLKLKNVQIIE
ncbi:DNA adenine methylase [Maribacter polysaccharolyticus]|uniref:DNA adenine methylase n=1 Tax=Maribacter polysaccharolyticus TaxID=3020831 RepID=UPI00237FB581|nr:DNA adenine methylase [Maribacter polysaccharolyticus]MDE3741772.1 DNA adenine methylase [Maribacter polysaccharolyticus]